MANICFIHYDFSIVGGTKTVCANLTAQLMKEHTVSILSLANTGMGTEEPLPQGVRHSYLLEKDHRLRWMVIKCFPKLIRYLKQNKIDVAFVLCEYPGLISTPVQPFVKTKFVFCDHGAIMSQWNDKKLRFMRRVASKASDCTVVLTDASRKAYLERFSLGDNKVRRIYNWIDDGVYRSPRYRSGQKRVITAGRFGPEKGYDMLLEIAHRVLPQRPDWKWDLYGNGETFEDIKTKCGEMGLSGQLTFKGTVRGLDRLYQDYSIFVLPSYREGLPVALLEAKANRLPAVSFDIVTGPGEMICDGVNGALVPAYDIELFAKRLGELMDSPSLREQYSEKTGLDLEKFSPQTVLQQWKDLIVELTDEK